MRAIRPSTALSLAIICTALAGAAAAQTAETAPAAPEQPSAEKLMEDSVEALGGEEAIQKIKSMRSVLKGSIPAPAGASSDEVEMTIETFWSRDGGRLVKISTPDLDMERGSDGKVAWTKTPTGYQLLTEAQADEANEQAGMFMNILEPQRHAMESLESLKTVGRETFDGKDAYKLQFVSTNGDEGFMYYDAASALPLGFRSGGEGDVRHEQVVISDWKEQDGVQFFRKMTITSSQQPAPATVEVTELEVNKVDETIFVLPEEVKALAERTRSSEGSSAEATAEVALEDLTPEQQQQATQILDRFKSNGNVEEMKQMVNQLEPFMAMLPPEDQPVMQYVLQELKKEIKRLEG